MIMFSQKSNNTKKTFYFWLFCWKVFFNAKSRLNQNKRERTFTKKWLSQNITKSLIKRHKLTKKTPDPHQNMIKRNDFSQLIKNKIYMCSLKGTLMCVVWFCNIITFPHEIIKQIYRKKLYRTHENLMRMYLSITK